MSPDPIIQHLKEIDARNICDAGCGCGIYSLKLAMNGFIVSGFDIAENAVNITKNILAEKGFQNDSFKAKSVLDTGFASNYFDATVSRDVIDHMPIRQAVLAVKELLRITKPGGSVILTLDGSDDEYENEPHIVNEDGDYLFKDGKWNGMVFHSYSESEIEKLTDGLIVKHIDRLDDGYVVIIEKVVKNNKPSIIEFSEEYIEKVIEYEKKLREEEPDTYFWEPDDAYRNKLIASFHDNRFTNAVSFVAIKEGKIIGRIDASIVASRCDAECCTAYLDWISVLKSERHNQVAQMMLKRLRQELKEKGASLFIALMAGNDEAQRFYRNIENASVHDEGVWIDL